MGVAGCEHPFVNFAQVGVIQDAPYQPAAQTPAAVLFKHEHVSEVREAGVVGHGAGEPDLAATVIQAERQGVLYGA